MRTRNLKLKAMRKINLLLFSILFLQIDINCQTGPGGVGNLSNNVIWLDAERLGLSNGAPVASWTDFSGNNNHFTQAVSTSQPTFVTNVVNARPVVSFSNDYLELGSTAALNSSDFSQIIVTASNSTKVGSIIRSSYTSGAGSASNQYWGTFQSNVGSAFAPFTRNTSGSMIATNIGYQTGYNILSSVISSASNSVSGYFNNNFTGTALGYNSIPTGHQLTRIGVNTASLSSYYNGGIAEIIVFNTTLNSAQLNIINNYLSAKYRTTISNDIYSHSFPHYYEVFGVGQEADGSNLTAQGSGIVEFSNPTLANGDYILAGHDNESITNVSYDVPPLLAPATRLRRTWRVDATGAPGTLDVSFDIGSTVYASDPNLYLVVENNDGVFNNGGTTIYGPASPVAGKVTFTGVSLPNNSYFSLFGPDKDILSVKTGDWTDPTTWNCNCVPDLTRSASVLNGHTVTVNTSTADVNHLSVNSGATLNFSFQSILSIYGDFNLDGLITNHVSNQGRIEFKGSTLQAFRNLSPSTVNLYNLYVSNPQNVRLILGSIDVHHSIRVTSGQLQNISSTCSLISTSSKTAIIFDGSTGNGFSGNFVIQRFISARNSNWGGLSSPVNNNHLQDWDSDPTMTINELYMSGVNGINGNSCCPIFKSVYSYDATTQSYVAVNDTSEVLTRGKGFEIWMADTVGSFYAKTIDSRGTPNYGNIAVSLVNSFNLVGNPYAAWILWSKLSKPTLKSTYYVYNTNNGSYDAKTSGAIPPHQAFFVESVGSGTLTFTESSKYSSNSSGFSRVSDDYIEYPAIDNEEFTNVGDEPFDFVELKVNINSDINPYNHTLKLRINEQASINEDLFDATFKESPLLDAPSITTYSNSSTKQLAINSFNYVDEITIPLLIDVAYSGIYNIDFKGISEFKSMYKVIEVKDLNTNKIYDLNANEAISLFIGDMDNKHRLNLILNNKLMTDQFNENILNQIDIYNSDEKTYIDFVGEYNGEYTLTIYNTIGQKLISDKYYDPAGVYSLNSSILNNKGVMIVELSGNDKKVIKKLIY